MAAKAAKAAKWEGRYLNLETGRVVKAFQILRMQELIGGGVDLRGARGGEFLDYTPSPAVGDFLVRRWDGSIFICPERRFCSLFELVPAGFCSVRKPCPLCRRLLVKLKALLDEHPS